MPIYWFFDLPIVAHHNKLLSQLAGTQTIQEALYIYASTASPIPRRASFRIPLPVGPGLPT